LAWDLPVSNEAAEREEIFLGLRLSEGVPTASLERQMNRSGDARLAGDYENWIAQGILEHDGGRVRLTERGFLVSNEVLSRFV
jgi:oxygen-independent coproporphyrinogen-3 oxidase